MLLIENLSFKPIVDFEFTFHNFHLCLSAYHHSRVMHSLGESGLKCSESTASIHGRLKLFRFHGQNLWPLSEVSVQVHATIELRNWVPEASRLAPLPAWSSLMLEPQLVYLSVVCLGSDTNCCVNLTTSIPVLWKSHQIHTLHVRSSEETLSAHSHTNRRCCWCPHQSPNYMIYISYNTV